MKGCIDTNALIAAPARGGAMEASPTDVHPAASGCSRVGLRCVAQRDPRDLQLGPPASVHAQRQLRTPTKFVLMKGTAK